MEAPERSPAGEAPGPEREISPGRARAAKLLGSFFGVGFLPMAPGTWGSLAALIIYLPIRFSGLDQYTLGCLALFVFFSTASLVLGRDAERAAGGKDPRWFVLDEMAGVFLALFGLATYNFALVGLAFLLFRLFDALKIGAVGWVEERFGGSVGIWLDDVVAASIANLLVRSLLITLLVKCGVDVSAH